jgi:hypothetical protein
LHFLFVCKRTHDENTALPTFCGYEKVNGFITVSLCRNTLTLLTAWCAASLSEAACRSSVLTHFVAALPRFARHMLASLAACSSLSLLAPTFHIHNSLQDKVLYQALSHFFTTKKISLGKIVNPSTIFFFYLNFIVNPLIFTVNSHFFTVNPCIFCRFYS